MDAFRTYVTRELDVRTLPRAFPLLQAAFGLGLDECLRYVCASADRAGGGEPAGFMTVEDHKGYVVGVLRYRVVGDPLAGRNLECDHVMVPDTVRPDLPFDGLVEGGETLARRHGCVRLSLTMSVAEPAAALPAPLRGALERRGFRFDSVRFCKAVGAARAERPGAAETPSELREEIRE